MFEIDRSQLKSFAEDGYLVLPQAVSKDLVKAARLAVAAQIRKDPPNGNHRGPHFYFLFPELPTELTAPLYGSGAIRLAESLITPGASLEPPDHVQISLNIPLWDHRPGGPHIDGLTPVEPDGRPGTFTVLAGVFLTDQLSENAGNLWVWPGSHRGAGAYFAENGPDSLRSCIPYPPICLAEPKQITGAAGDILLAHYMLGHNMGGNVSEVVREVLYFRLRRARHREHWRMAIQDPFYEFEPVRAAWTP